MREYSKISTTIWRSRKFRGLKDDRHRLFYLYLHTCPHVNMVGCFVLPRGYAETDLGWTSQAVRKAIESLSQASLIAFDPDEDLIRIRDFLSHDPFTNWNHAKGAIKQAILLPNCYEKLSLFKELMNNRFASKDTRIPEIIERLSKASPKPIETQNQNQNQNQNPVTTAASQPAGKDERFEEFKGVYPKRYGQNPWPRARKAINARLKEGHSWDEIIAGARRYRKFMEAEGKLNTSYVQQAATFCGPDKGFLEPWTPKPAAGNGKPLTANDVAAIRRRIKQYKKQGLPYQDLVAQIEGYD